MAEKGHEKAQLEKPRHQHDHTDKARDRKHHDTVLARAQVVLVHLVSVGVVVVPRWAVLLVQGSQETGAQDQGGHGNWAHGKLARLAKDGIDESGHRRGVEAIGEGQTGELGEGQALRNSHRPHRQACEDIGLQSARIHRLQPRQHRAEALNDPCDIPRGLHNLHVRRIRHRLGDIDRFFGAVFQHFLNTVLVLTSQMSRRELRQQHVQG
mmetsp:Transcript_84540/g.244371  ORF Transcript_84540/g.244371 Transcript_84540/m.244371 type:complete len:210 (+) Transcript_84540:2148-2777(+)